MRNWARMFTSSSNRASTAALIQADAGAQVQARRIRTSHHAVGRRPASTCRSENLPRSSATGCNATFPGKILSSPRRCPTKTSPPFQIRWCHYSAEAFVYQLAPNERYERNPLIWGPSYATGISAAARFDKFDLAVELKNASLSSRPETWDALDSGFDQPTISARVGFRPNESWNFGFSASGGPYYRPEAAPILPRGRDIEDFRELLLGQDISLRRASLAILGRILRGPF